MDAEAAPFVLLKYIAHKEQIEYTWYNLKSKPSSSSHVLSLLVLEPRDSFPFPGYTNLTWTTLPLSERVSVPNRYTMIVTIP